MIVDYLIELSLTPELSALTAEFWIKHPALLETLLIEHAFYMVIVSIALIVIVFMNILLFMFVMYKLLRRGD